jgi:8-oxo-dGTP pyrophosphatase MutT (NUDIX family)
MMGRRFVEGLKRALAGEKGGLEAQLQMAPDFRSEEIRRRSPENNPRKSAVIILLNPFADELSLVFTKRSPRLKVHRGQVSFPGGQMDKDDRDLLETALREMREEIGIAAEDIQLLGQLSDLFIPPSNFDVAVFVAVLMRPPKYRINPDEVEDVVEIPLRMLLEPENIKRKVFYKTTSGVDRSAPYYAVKDLEIWGATAMIVSELVELIRKQNLYK